MKQTDWKVRRITYISFYILGFWWTDGRSIWNWVSNLLATTASRCFEIWDHIGGFRNVCWFKGIQLERIHIAKMTDWIEARRIQQEMFSINRGWEDGENENNGVQCCGWRHACKPAAGRPETERQENNTCDQPQYPGMNCFEIPLWCVSITWNLS